MSLSGTLNVNWMGENSPQNAGVGVVSQQRMCPFISALPNQSKPEREKLAWIYDKARSIWNEFKDAIGRNWTIFSDSAQQTKQAPINKQH